MRSEYRNGFPGAGDDHSQQSQYHKPGQLYPVQVATLPKHILTDSIWS